MTPLPTNPTVVILVNPEGKIEAVASNIDPELKVAVTTQPSIFREWRQGKPFVQPPEFIR